MLWIFPRNVLYWLSTELPPPCHLLVKLGDCTVPFPLSGQNRLAEDAPNQERCVSSAQSPDRKVQLFLKTWDFLSKFFKKSWIDFMSAAWRCLKEPNSLTQTDHFSKSVIWTCSSRGTQNQYDSENTCLCQREHPLPGRSQVHKKFAGHLPSFMGEGADVYFYLFVNSLTRISLAEKLCRRSRSISFFILLLKTAPDKWQLFQR